MSAPDRIDPTTPACDGDRQWVTPRLDRIPLGDALSGNAGNGPFPDATQTYPS